MERGRKSGRAPGGRFLGAVERLGNRLPHPITLFAGLCLGVAAVSALCRALGSRRRAAVTEWAVRQEKRRPTREDLAALLARARGLFAAALLLLYGQQPGELDRETAQFLAKNLTKTQIVRTMELLQKYHGECAYNVGTGHVLGALAVELEGIL